MIKVLFLFDDYKTFDKNYYFKNEELFKQTYNWLEDGASKEIFIAYLKSKITKNSKYLIEKYSSPQYFDECIKLYNDITFIDIGAYTGDTTEEFLKQSNNQFYKIYCFEADKNNAKILSDNFKDNNKVVPIAKGAYSENTILRFNSLSNTASGIDENGDVKIEVVKIDDYIKDVSNNIFLKADIEGSELEMLKGAQNLIKKYSPQIAICVYHKIEDLITIPQYLKSLNKDYKFYLRHHSNTLCDETVLYAI